MILTASPSEDSTSTSVKRPYFLFIRLSSAMKSLAFSESISGVLFTSGLLLIRSAMDLMIWEAVNLFNTRKLGKRIVILTS